MTQREKNMEGYIDDLKWTIWVLENPENEIPENERKIESIREIIQDFKNLKSRIKEEKRYEKRTH